MDPQSVDSSSEDYICEGKMGSGYESISIEEDLVLPERCETGLVVLTGSKSCEFVT